MRQQFIFCILCYNSFSVFCVINNMFFIFTTMSQILAQSSVGVNAINFTFGKIFQISCNDIICMNRFHRCTLHCIFKQFCCHHSKAPFLCLVHIAIYIIVKKIFCYISYRLQNSSYSPFIPDSIPRLYCYCTDICV